MTGKKENAMIARNSTAAVLAVLLAGCGSGGGETAVSANPPVAAAPTPAPAPVAATPVATPAPAPGLVPAPSPVTAIPPAPAKVPEPPAAAPGPPTPAPVQVPPPEMITGAALDYSLRENYGNPSSWTQLIGALDGRYANFIAITQEKLCPGPREYGMGCYYRSQSFDWQGSGLMPVTIGASWADDRAPFNLPRSMGVNGITMTRADDFTVDKGKEYALNQTLAQWDAPPHFLQLQIQSDTKSGVYRLCWHYQIPNIARLSCANARKSDGFVDGVHLVDDSYGKGPKTYRSQ